SPPLGFWRPEGRIFCRLMKKVLLLLLLPFCGCFHSKDELVVNADGSGVVTLETELLLSAAAISPIAEGLSEREEASTLYPPTDENEAKAYFPKDFEVTVKEDVGPGGFPILHVTAKFRDINALLASRYA